MTINCLICHAELLPLLGWSALFLKEKPRYLCDVCQAKWERINGHTCKRCDRPMSEEDGDTCFDCIRWEKDAVWADCLTRNHSIVEYNDFCKEVIARFKYRGDYILAYPIAEMMKGSLLTIEYDFLVAIPLSTERQYERGFNQSEAIITALGEQSLSVLTRIHTEKQSKKSRAERIHLPQVFQLVERAVIQEKSLVLIDDIYTTGSTLRNAAKLLIEAGAKKVSSLTIARG
ncbi:ComF family protein [Cytobacillus purgationiresistens]|uniref:Competence protein ComFC n=1 Tax=Cytobacillus purgationiresistens TaxID=863449 RepID=A0ABU0ACW3_9BACI|nr:ComF family protein [Cytobacillus purgationiresistens]MDQ0269097.1 competence protein ComFC [Cytobacillus purgationiresistens]